MHNSFAALFPNINFSKVKEALKGMASGKTVEPDNIVIYLLRYGRVWERRIWDGSQSYSMRFWGLRVCRMNGEEVW